MEDDIKMMVILILLMICLVLSGIVFALYGEARENTKEIEYLQLMCGENEK